MTSEVRETLLPASVGAGHPSGTAGRGPKAPWIGLADRLVDAAWEHASPAGALLRLPGVQSASGAWNDGLEGYARTFLAAAFRVRGQDGEDPRGFLQRYTDGLRAGVDPGHAERWPTFDERRGAIVEAASIAVALSETRPWLWDGLDERDQDRTITWLSHVLGRQDFTNNWIWFQNVIEAFLDSVGAESRTADLDRNHEIAEALYVGDGWYSDGRGREGQRQNFDWYAGWAWHLYPLLESRIRGTPLSAVHQDRLHRYLEQAQHLIGSEGAPVLIGRSVTYRFAVLGPFWAGVLAASTPLPAGRTRIIGEQMLAHFGRHGAIGEDGLLSIGWHHPYPRVRQLYTGSSSPYWASKGLLGLLLPADHAEWRTESEPAPDPEPVRTTAMPAPGWLVVSSPADGLVRVLNHGSDRVLEPLVAPRSDDPFYGRIGYSNATSPQLDAEGVARPYESHTTVLDESGNPAHRDRIEQVCLDETVAVSRSSVHWLDRDGGEHTPGWSGLRRGPQLTVASVVHGIVELRLAWWQPGPVASGRAASPAAIDSDAAWPREHGPWRIRFGGWALAAPAAADLDAGFPASESDTVGTIARVRREDGVVSAVYGLHEASHPDVRAGTGADPFGHWSAAPSVRTQTPREAGRLAAALVVLSHGEAAVPVPVITPERSTIRVEWPDGSIAVVPAETGVTW
ncbi:DUF2264 domain-containing protein [Ruania suaedae]|uniref:DUF2264 domain-containing protein n=1 Tax=Ruania suaedae TaxID=2897774 RepID=UPI001E5FDE68|nr:DUF2264 domain-containing protein [Ruania suaedae]UFU03920.1 DUF2264 domain-containing protein [Ruania suaedae]